MGRRVVDDPRDGREIFLHSSLGEMNPNFLFYLAKVVQWTNHALKVNDEPLDILPHVMATITSLKSYCDCQEGQPPVKRRPRKQIRKVCEMLESLDKLKEIVEQYIMEQMEQRSAYNPPEKLKNSFEIKMPEPEPFLNQNTGKYGREEIMAQGTPSVPISEPFLKDKEEKYEQKQIMAQESYPLPVPKPFLNHTEEK
ncbi:hypothetical protein M422DRAFT_242226 [Sphaerobolus stellatus SS14]|nr:hypothetical protein M422DRAFT_242226 [Sphaerobolus stellatus SS14]